MMFEAGLEVWCDYVGRWIDGFRLVEIREDDDGSERYVVRRLSDGAVLPVPFTARDVRASSAVGSSSMSR